MNTLIKRQDVTAGYFRCYLIQEKRENSSKVIDRYLIRIVEEIKPTITDGINITFLIICCHIKSMTIEKYFMF